jgi:membrane-bound lytic murein transglycosylase A
MKCRIALAIGFMLAVPIARSDIPAHSRKAMTDPVQSAVARTLPAGTIARPLAFSAIEGWQADDPRAALAAFLETCKPILDGTAALRDALPPPEALQRACGAARGLVNPAAAEARAFFETQFEPFEIIPEAGAGFLTAYFEPEIEASLTPDPDFPVPVLARPDDLVTLRAGETRAGIDSALQAARRTSGGFEPYPDRQAIWAGALDGQNLAIAWLRDHAELFITQVQGSARLVLPDGKRSRLVYAGRNGHPYTSIGKRLVENGDIPLPEMSLARLMGWLRSNPQRGRALMEENRSYVFFARDDAAPANRGPIGGAGIPLTTGRSLAVDRTIWPYGLPVFVDMAPLTPEGGRQRLARLMVAQDTGSAIVGPARGDYFMGSGRSAGEQAGLVRDASRFIVFWPRDRAP